MGCLSGLLFFFGAISLVVGLTTNDAVAWTSAGISMLFVAVVLFITSFFVNKD